MYIMTLILGSSLHPEDECRESKNLSLFFERMEMPIDLNAGSAT
jgi:hypothetical protein